jgi:hypothetical protein
MKNTSTPRRLAQFLLLGLLSTSFGACSYKDGKLTTQSRFSFPNSNVIPLGPVMASVTRPGFIVSADLPDEKWRGLTQEALKKVDGANILINYTQDTIYTTIPVLPVSFVTYRVSGTAARMNVGMQELH